MTAREHLHSDSQEATIEKIRGIVSEENIEHFSNDELLDACLKLVSTNQTGREEINAEDGPHRGHEKSARHTLLDHIARSTTVDEKLRTTLRVAVGTLYDRRPSDRVRRALEEAKAAAATQETIAGNDIDETFIELIDAVDEEQRSRGPGAR